MKITIFGATGALGSECLKQALEDGHEVTALIRSASRLPDKLKEKITLIEGDGLNPDDVKLSLSNGTEAILFAIGVDKNSPTNLCTDITKHILEGMQNTNIRRFIWCGGGSTFVKDDQITTGAKIVRNFAKTFMSLRHEDKENQYKLLQQHRDIDWIGIRPLQMKKGRKTTQYRLGYDTFNGMSTISFADCAHAMLNMLTDDAWIGETPIIQY